MGKWEVGRLFFTTSKWESTIDVGHNFYVKIPLRYTPRDWEEFQELPPLKWYETIRTTVQHEGSTSLFEEDMYKYKPGSKTFNVIWATCDDNGASIDFAGARPETQIGGPVVRVLTPTTLAVLCYGSRSAISPAKADTTVAS